MDLSQIEIEEVLLPYEKKLCAQEKLRRFLGIKNVDRPTYERYTIGDIEQFDRRKNPISLMMQDNPFGEDIRERIKKRTGYDFHSTLPYSELEPVDRLGQSLTQAAWRLCREHHPRTLPVTPRESRVEMGDKALAARLVKKVALFFGAEMVRITKINRRWVYQDSQISHPYAIVLVVSHIRSFLGTAPSHFSSAAVANTYSRLKFITTQLADFICGLGYDAAYRETLGNNPELLMVPLAIDAGVGEFARTGQCLSPEFGVNMRIKAVTTDLPLEVDKPISFGVHEFCMACENCAAYCPASAIPFGPPTDKPVDIYSNPGFRKWYINAERCLTFWNKNKKKWTTCGGRCLAVCPWNKDLNIYHNAVRWMVIHAPVAAKKVLVQADRLIYGRTKRIRNASSPSS